MTRKKRESDSRRREEKWQACWCCQGQQRACRMAQISKEKLEYTGPAKKVRVASVPQKEQLACTPQRPLPKVKATESSVHSTRSWGRESRWVRATPWQERRGSEQEHGEERVDSLVKEGRFKGGKGGHARRPFLEQVEGSMSR